MAASATFALKPGVWFRRGRLLMVSPDKMGTACPLSGRNSTYRPVQISGTGTYYQQVGRAGRAIDHAVGILMSGEEDAKIHEFFRRSAFPKEAWVRAILGELEESDGLTTRQLEEAVNLRSKQIEQVLKFLSVENPAPIIKSGSQWQRTPVSLPKTISARSDGEVRLAQH